MAILDELEAALRRVNEAIPAMEILNGDGRARLVRQFANALDVPVIVYSPADLVAVSTNWKDDEMNEEELTPHNTLAAAAYPLLPRLLGKADQDYSVLEWALANARTEMENAK